VEKVWGWEEIFVNIPGKYCGKRLTIREGYQTSWHAHNTKDETFLITQGYLWLYYMTPDHRTLLHVARPGDSMRLLPGIYHRLAAPEGQVELIEFSDFHSDDDTVRVEAGGPITAY
jgi:quercetin dioxygenase-like cupin family protein